MCTSYRTMVQELLKRRAEPGVLDARGRTPLMVSTSVDIMRALAPITDIEHREAGTGRTVFHLVAGGGFPQCLAVLLPQRPAALTALRDAWGMTPLHHACGAVTVPDSDTVIDAAATPIPDLLGEVACVLGD
jgi:ankyrin repeat protein